MGRVIVDLTVSLDGFIAGPDDGLDLPLGRGGMALFTWMTAGPEKNRMERRLCPPDRSKVVIEEWMNDTGAIISGRRTYDIAGGWADGHPIDAPIFVLTHHPPEEAAVNPKISFVTEGIERALDLAQEAAADKMVSVDAADTTQQLLRLGSLDEIQVSVVPLLLGGGVRLLDHIGAEPITLEQTRVIESEGVTHLRYRVVRS